MRKILATFLAFVCLFFVSCDTVEKTDKEITCADVLAAYEQAGYEVFHKETASEEGGYCYVKATDSETEEYIFFHFFENIVCFFCFIVFI